MTPRCAVLTLALILMPCGLPDAQTERPLTYVSKQCNENAIELRLDPGPFKDVIGPNFALRLDSGKAVVLIVVQDCSQEWINGEDFGLGQEVHLWVAVRGTEDIRPVVGAERTMPTRTWFTLFDGCNSPRIREARMVSGAPVHPIDSVLLALSGSTGSGWFSLEKNSSYSWNVPSPAKPLARLVGINHDVYLRDTAGNVVLKRIQAITHPAAGRSQGILKVTGENARVATVHPGTYPVWVQMFSPIWVRTTVGLPAAEGGKTR